MCGRLRGQLVLVSHRLTEAIPGAADTMVESPLNLVRAPWALACVLTVFDTGWCGHTACRALVRLQQRHILLCYVLASWPFIVVAKATLSAQMQGRTLGPPRFSEQEVGDLFKQLVLARSSLTGLASPCHSPKLATYKLSGGLPEVRSILRHVHPACTAKTQAL